MNKWGSVLKTSGFSILLLSLLFVFFSWVLYPVFLPREYVNKKKDRLS